MRTRTLPSSCLVSLLLTACLTSQPAEDTSSPERNELNLAAGSMVLYEVQARSANASDPSVGADWQRSACAARVAPRVTYHAEGMGCAGIDGLQRIRLGTLDDLLEDTADFQQGITLRYVREQVGANTLWLMPLFPNNDAWSLPDPCDNLGSPYAVRDYFHVRAALSRSCILAGQEGGEPDTACWGNDVLDRTVAQAHGRGMKVILDVALNHFGHNYLMYDVAGVRSIRDRLAAGEDLGRLWDFAATDEESLVHPTLIDTPEALDALAAGNDAARADLDALQARCPDLSGLPLVRAFAMWSNALGHERESFACSADALEVGLPGFYLRNDRRSPARSVGEMFTNEWRDVKFLYHRADNPSHGHEFVRNREYFFRVLNYWVSRGVDGFRLDHTTDGASGLSPAEWDYIVSKVDYYAWRRGQSRPVFLAEEFADHQGLDQVVDIMTEGYVTDINGRGGVTKDAGRVEWILGNMNRLSAYVMTALETHDEHRLVDGTGFNWWTGAGFWGIGAATRSTPMLLMGQEIGEGWGLAFRKSDYLRSRFGGDPSAQRALTGFYRGMIQARLRPENRALLMPSTRFLRTKDGNAVDSRILAMARWGDGNSVFVFHNLWEQTVEQAYYVPPDAADAMGIRDAARYRLVDAFTGAEVSGCRRGADLKWELYVRMDAHTRLQWLRLEECGP